MRSAVRTCASLATQAFRFARTVRERAVLLGDGRVERRHGIVDECELIRARSGLFERRLMCSPGVNHVAAVTRAGRALSL